MRVFPQKEKLVRQRLWQSIILFDHLLAAILGRPLATADDESLGQALLTAESQNGNHSALLSDHDQSLCNSSIVATLRACRLVGQVLSKVYQRGQVSTHVAQELADMCIQWSEELPSSLYWQQATSHDQRIAIAVFHTNCIHCYSIILLTRPYHLHFISDEMQMRYLRQRPKPRSDRHNNQIRRFHNACVIASSRAIATACNAYNSGHVSSCNLLLINVLFGATLVLLTQELLWPLEHADARQHIEDSIRVLEDCGKRNPEARRAEAVVLQFQDLSSDRSPAEKRTFSQQERERPLGQPVEGYSPSYFVPSMLSRQSSQQNNDVPSPLTSKSSTWSRNIPEPTSEPLSLENVFRATGGGNENPISTPPYPYPELEQTVYPIGWNTDQSVAGWSASGTDEALDLDGLWQFASYPLDWST